MHQATTGAGLTSLLKHYCVVQVDCMGSPNKMTQVCSPLALASLSPPTHPITITSATPTCQTSSTFGYVAHCDQFSQTSSPRSPCPRLRNLWLPLIGTEARKKRRRSSSTA